MKITITREEYNTIKELKERFIELSKDKEAKKCEISHHSTRGKTPHRIGEVIECDNLNKFYRLLDIKEEMEKHIEKVLYNNIDDANNVVVSLRNDYIHTQWIILIDFK